MRIARPRSRIIAKQRLGRRVAPGSRIALGASLLLMSCATPAGAQSVAVLTRGYDPERTGANARETELTPQKVAQQGLRRLFSAKVDDPRIEAQPLIVPGVRMADGTTHDVLYVCSMENTVWAFDATTPKAGTKDANPLWPQPARLGTSVKPRVLKPGDPGFDADHPTQRENDRWGVNVHWGILSTPVVDPDTNTLYVVAWTSPDSSTKKAVFELHALDLATGSPRPKSPVTIAASVTPPGGAKVDFKGNKQKQRSSLLLLKVPAGNGAPAAKAVVVAFSGGDTDDPNEKGQPGWVLAYDPATLQQTAAWASAPRTIGGGIWAAGQGPSTDGKGNVFVMTGNGGWDGQADFSESIIKLAYNPPAAGAAGKLDAAEWFTPYRDADRGVPDQDLGSAAAVVMPDLNAVAGAGKDGILYVLDVADLGQTTKAELDAWKAGQPGQHHLAALKADPLYVTFNGLPFSATTLEGMDQAARTKRTHHLHGSPVYFKDPDKGPMLFCWGENENLRAWAVEPAAGGRLQVKFLALSNEAASADSDDPGGMPGGMLTLSANGATPGTAIVWATVPLNGKTKGHPNKGDANRWVVEGILYAYDATQFGPPAGGNPTLKLLWNSRDAGEKFKFDKFCPPVVANGKVYVATYDGRVIVYGL